MDAVKSGVALSQRDEAALAASFSHDGLRTFWRKALLFVCLGIACAAMLAAADLVLAGILAGLLLAVVGVGAEARQLPAYRRAERANAWAVTDT